MQIMQAVLHTLSQSSLIFTPYDSSEKSPAGIFGHKGHKDRRAIALHIHNYFVPFVIFCG
jgi:hypothetical protein